MKNELMNNEFLINMAINVLLTLLGGSLKDPAAKAKYKRVMLKIYTSIKSAFPDDPDFQ